MKKFLDGVTTYRKTIVIGFLLLGVLGGLLFPKVSVNYKMEDYLPSDAQSTVAIEVMKDEFGGEMPNARVMVKGVTLEQALMYKTKIAAISGVLSVNWLDDAMDISNLSAMPQGADMSFMEDYYKDQAALFTVTIQNGKEKETTDAIYELIGVENALAGQAPNMAATQNSSVTEVARAFLILLPIILVILLIATTSWLEPLLFFVTIGIAVAINMGTNLIFSKISFITLTVSPILQLAVSLDYAIFLLHSFREYRKETANPSEAMRLAIKRAFVTVSASAITTVVGFFALIFMRFGIGSDLGLNLVKGVLISFVTVMTLLPALSLLFIKLLDKTSHKSFMPSFQKVSDGLLKARIPFLILALLVVIPCFIGQSKTDFSYGSGSVAQSSRAGQDAVKIDEAFGKENMLVLLVPKDKLSSEAVLCADLSKISHVTKVVSYVTTVGADVPVEYAPESVVKQFYSQHYARILLYTDLPEEGKDTFDTIKNIEDTVKTEGSYLAGQSAVLYDMKQVVSKDTTIVNLISILGVLLVLLIAFRSFSLPVILVFIIETAIWINLSISYFAGQQLMYIGYLIIGTVQLGATVDYAILMTNRYLAKRQELPKLEAMRETLSGNISAVLTSAGILAAAGFCLAAAAANPIVSELGSLLGRGTLLSLAMVVLVLPALLLLCDRVIQKTTLKSKS